MAKEELSKRPAGETEVAPAQQPPAQINVDMSNTNSSYANWYRVICTPEEIILDLGLNPEHGAPVWTQPIKITERVVMSFFTAKRLLHHLQLGVARHESAFGPVEVDAQKRSQDRR